MLKNILKLEGAQKLTKKELKEVNGGAGLIRAICPPEPPICSDPLNYDCEEKRVYYNTFCVNG
jgi:bacteriocin-like protein